MSTVPVKTVSTAGVSAAAGGWVTARTTNAAVVTTSAVTTTAAALRRRAATKTPPLEWRQQGTKGPAPTSPYARGRGLGHFVFCFCAFPAARPAAYAHSATKLA